MTRPLIQTKLHADLRRWVDIYGLPYVRETLDLMFPPAQPVPPRPAPTVAPEMGGKVGRDHPDTSRRAATPPRFGSQRWKVLEALVELGPKTSAELAPTIERSRNQTATRVLELRELGFVADTGHKRSTGPADEGTVWAATATGRDYVRSTQVAVGL